MAILLVQKQFMNVFMELQINYIKEGEEEAKTKFARISIILFL